MREKKKGNVHLSVADQHTRSALLVFVDICRLYFTTICLQDASILFAVTSRPNIYADQHDDAERSAASQVATTSKKIALIAGEQNGISQNAFGRHCVAKKISQQSSRFVVRGEQKRYVSRPFVLFFKHIDIYIKKYECSVASA